MQEAVRFALVSRLRGQLTEVRRADEADADLLVAWHADPEVARYWDGETYTREQILAELRRRAGRRVDRRGRRRARRLPPVVVGGRRRRGGAGWTCSSCRPRADGGWARMRRGRSRDRLVAEGWAEVTVDPYLWNERAIRAWTKAGFVPVEERPADAEHTAPGC